MEHWEPLLDYQNYSVSDQGRVRSDKSGAVLANALTPGNRPYVRMTYQGRQVSRGLALLVCQTFIPFPNHNIDNPTPIHLDGDPRNCRAENLQWRPRWFAQKHARQFHQNFRNPNAIRDIKTGRVYNEIWDVVLERGLLFSDVFCSIVNCTRVFPGWDQFEWVDPY